MPESDLRSMSKEERRARFEERQGDSVGYSNPKTGHSASYNLDVEYNTDGTVARINFSNGGWIDDFASDTANSDGTRTLVTSEGREFTVPQR